MSALTVVFLIGVTKRLLIGVTKRLLTLQLTYRVSLRSVGVA
jgi:hypothetical protein